MTIIISPSLSEETHKKHEHLGFSGIYAVFADRFRVRREEVTIKVTALEYHRMSSARTLTRLARKLKSEFDGAIEISAGRTVSTTSKTYYFIKAHARPL